MNVSTQVVKKRISDIRPYTRNPRVNNKTVDALCELIPQVGFNVPIVIDKNGVIIKGHARYKAAIRLGMEYVPCIVSDADDEANKLDRISDNRVSEFSEWVSGDLLDELHDIKLDFSSLDFPVASNFQQMPWGSDNSSVPSAPQQAYVPVSSDDNAPASAPVAGQTPSVNVFVNSNEHQEEHASEPQSNAQTGMYARVVCGECGHIFFVSYGDVEME